MDGSYFLRGKHDSRLHHDGLYPDRDSSYSTYCGTILAEILANEMLETYLDARLAKLDREGINNEPVRESYPVGKWTDKKNALGEIIYGMDSLGSVGGGNVNIKVLAAVFGEMFGVDMGNIYQIYLEIRGRKTDRTEYLNRMVKALNARMDDDDNR